MNSGWEPGTGSAIKCIRSLESTQNSTSITMEMNFATSSIPSFEATNSDFEVSKYSKSASKIKSELGWEPSLQFEEGLEKTVQWYLKKYKS